MEDDGGLLRDSGDLGYIYETEEEANEEVKVTMEEYIENWEIDGGLGLCPRLKEK